MNAKKIQFVTKSDPEEYKSEHTSIAGADYHKLDDDYSNANNNN